MVRQPNRRHFLQSSVLGTAALTGPFSFLGKLPRVSAEDAQVTPGMVRFDQHVEPLVRMIEETDRDKLLEQVAGRIHSGTSYQELLAALLLAGVRNVQPRPSVGFKFHAVLVVNSCHLASIAGPDEDRWLPIFWAIDHFKSAQADEARQSGWHMDPVDEARVPPAHQAAKVFTVAMDRWDVDQADVAIAALCRTGGATEVFNLLAQYAARDFRSIGHKAIFLANGWRTLQVIGWEHAEPVLRSLAFAMLAHTDEPNPANSDLAPDRPWRENEKLLTSFSADWQSGKTDAAATRSLIEAMRQATPTDSARQAVEVITAHHSPQTVWDAVFVGAGELLMRQPGIVGLHGLTTANAVHYIYQHAADPRLRQRLLLQACSFNAMFRDAAQGRGKLGSQTIADLQAARDETGDASVETILKSISSDRMQAGKQLERYLSQGNDPYAFVDAARRLIFLKGRNAHDYKYSSAVLEDFSHVSPEWRNTFLALSVFNLKGSGDRNSDLIERTRSALS